MRSITPAEESLIKVLPRRQQAKCKHQYRPRMYYSARWKYLCTKCGAKCRD